MMKTRVLIATAAATAIAFLAFADQTESLTPANATLKDVAWLVGDWRSENAKRVSSEYWFPAEAGVMFGLNRSMQNDTIIFFEYMRLTVADGVLTFIASPAGQPGASFKLVAIRPNHAEFANPKNDYPQRIIYQRDRDTLAARIEGPGKSGKTNVTTWTWKLRK